MQSVMKSTLFMLVTVIGAMVAVVPAHAQSGSRLTANVPFDFSVGNVPLKAGSYKIAQLESGVLAFNSDDGRQYQITLTNYGDSGTKNQTPHLVFMRYGSEAFLKKAFLSFDDTYHSLPLSSREKKLIQERSSGTELSVLIQPAR